MKVRRKHTRREDQYMTIAAGYHILRSPLADSYRAAAEHYRHSDPPNDDGEEAENAPAHEREAHRH